MKIAGKENFVLDPHIKTSYLLRLRIKYACMLLKGWYSSIGHHDIASDVFIGSHVKLYSKNQLKIGHKTKIRAFTKIDALSIDGVDIGDHCTFGENCRIECTGSLEHIGKGIKIGNRTSFGSDCFLGAAGGIEIGNDVVAGQYIRFHSENYEFADTHKLIKDQGVTHKGIKVGNNC